MALGILLTIFFWAALDFVTVLVLLDVQAMRGGTGRVYYLVVGVFLAVFLLTRVSAMAIETAAVTSLLISLVLLGVDHVWVLLQDSFNGRLWALLPRNAWEALPRQAGRSGGYLMTGLLIGRAVWGRLPSSRESRVVDYQDQEE